MDNDPIAIAWTLMKLYDIEGAIENLTGKMKWYHPVGKEPYFAPRSPSRPIRLCLGKRFQKKRRVYRSIWSSGGAASYHRTYNCYPKIVTFKDSESLLRRVKKMVAERNPYE